MTSCIAGRRGPQNALLAPLVGIFLRWTDRNIQIRSVFLRTSGSSGVFESFLARKEWTTIL